MKIIITLNLSLKYKTLKSSYAYSNQSPIARTRPQSDWALVKANRVDFLHISARTDQQAKYALFC